ncbi:MAG: hypothetical protein JF615_16735, partial [Asticcacaulis sp.]|nr:hypothetical protein [Asticcacaulis sp.]
MFVESGASLLKAQISGLLVAFETGTEGGEEVALDLIELIALRMVT